MKRRTKLGFAVAITAFGVIALSSCTQSFCSQVDVARMKYAFEPGITRIETTTSETDTLTFHGESNTYVLKYAKLQTATWVYDSDTNVGDFVFNPNEENELKLKYLNSILKNSRTAGYVTIDGYSSIEYLKRFDYLALNAILGTAADKNAEEGGTITYELYDSVAGQVNEEQLAKFNRDLSYYSYARFASGNTGKSWKNWDEFDVEARKEIIAASVLDIDYFTVKTELSPDLCPSSDFIKFYKSKVSSFVSAYRTCLTTHTDKYGSYGYSTNGIYVTEKNWSYAWSKGFFEGLLVFPIGWLIDSIVLGFKGTGVSNGLSAFLGILFVTFIIRSLMLLATFKQTQSNAKMTELQPEIQKIQNKYPNSNTSQAEKQRMAEEMNRLYKKNKVNPFTTLIVLIVQFPVFICVWGALSGSSALTNGTFLGLNLSMTIKDALFGQVYWTAAGGYAAVTALFLFLFMAGAQTLSMLLPQWLQKARAKKVAKLGKNPAQASQNNKMKWFTYIMLAMIIFMGFSLVSAMGIYWFIGAIFSVGQTLITQYVTDHKKAKKQ